MTQTEAPTRATRQRLTWKALLGEGGPLLLPAAHDALTARLIERAGFKAYQVGGFALAGAGYACCRGLSQTSGRRVPHWQTGKDTPCCGASAG
jgi:hypothetical protein